MMEILNAEHNIVSVSPEDLPEHPRERHRVYYWSGQESEAALCSV